MTEILVEASHLVKDFSRGARAVDDVSFTIRTGESFGLVGESGSGKSTTAAILLGLEQPTSGTVRFGGHDVSRATSREMLALRRDMQLVMQDPVSSLNRRRTVEQIVGLPLKLHRRLDTRGRRAEVVRLLALVGLPEAMLTRYPHELSGGQCQRVNIARALAVSPKFLVLDESVSAIDVVMQAQILNLVKKLQHELGLTYLFVSHDLAVVRYMCERIAVMQHGRLVEVGTRAEIFSDRARDYTRELIAAAPASLARQRAL